MFASGSSSHGQYTRLLIPGRVSHQKQDISNAENRGCRMADSSKSPAPVDLERSLCGRKGHRAHWLALCGKPTPCAPCLQLPANSAIHEARLAVSLKAALSVPKATGHLLHQQERGGILDPQEEPERANSLPNEV